MTEATHPELTLVRERHEAALRDWRARQDAALQQHLEVLRTVADTILEELSRAPRVEIACPRCQCTFLPETIVNHIGSDECAANVEWSTAWDAWKAAEPELRT